MSSVRDVIGERGERLAYLHLTAFVPPNAPIFRPHFLGEKYRTLDFIVELEGAPGSLVPFFFVQVKTTTLGYTQNPRNLRVQVSREDMARLVSYPVPTYIVGIDEAQGKGYIVAAIAGGPSSIASLSTRHPLDLTALQLLYDEILRFWQTHGASFNASHFT